MANEYLKSFTEQKIRSGVVTDVETEILEAGLNENIIRQISQKKASPTGFCSSVSRLIAIGLTSPCPRLGTGAPARNRLSGHSLLCRPHQEEKREEGNRSRTDEDVRETRYSPRRAHGTGRGGRRRGDGLRVGEDDLQGTPAREGHYFQLILRSGARKPRVGAQIPRYGRALHRQLFRRPQLGRVLRRLVRLHPQGRALPHGALDLFPHQRTQHRAV